MSPEEEEEDEDGGYYEEQKRTPAGKSRRGGSNQQKQLSFHEFSSPASASSTIKSVQGEVSVGFTPEKGREGHSPVKLRRR